MFRVCKTICKRCHKIAQQKLKRKNYNEILTCSSNARSLNNLIRPRENNLETVVTNKINLSTFDNKRCIHTDKVKTTAFGHTIMREEMFFGEIGRNSDRGELDVEWSQPTTDNVGGGGRNCKKISEAQGGYNFEIFTIPDQGFFSVSILTLNLKWE